MDECLPPEGRYIPAKRYRAFTAEWSEEDDQEFEEDNFEVEDLENIKTMIEELELATKKRSRETDDDEDQPEGKKPTHTSAV